MCLIAELDAAPVSMGGLMMCCRTLLCQRLNPLIIQCFYSQMSLMAELKILLCLQDIKTGQRSRIVHKLVLLIMQTFFFFISPYFKTLGIVFTSLHLDTDPVIKQLLENEGGFKLMGCRN